MYNEFYGFSKDPFLIVPDPNYLYMSPKHEEALARMAYGIKNRRAVMLLTGEVGAGKTTLIRYLVRHLPKSIHSALITNSNLAAESLLRLILEEFSLPAQPSADKSTLIKSLQTHLEGLASGNQRGLLIIDEAQNLPLDALEEIRMLSNFQVNTDCLLQIILVGQPELRVRMKDPRCLQITQRIAFNYHIAALNIEETRAYIIYRLQRSGGTKELFTADALDMVFKLSRGIPRTINLVCDSALIYGFSEEHRVIDGAIVTKAATCLDLMGLVDAKSCGEAARPTQAAKGNGDGQAIVEGIGNLEKSIGVFIKELRTESQNFTEQAGLLRTSALSLSEALEKLKATDSVNYEKLHADSVKLKLLMKLINDDKIEDR
jgi:general secretion pathway protein A